MTNASLNESIVDYVNAEASLVVLVLDKNGRILKANRYAEQLMGEELLKGMFTDITLDFADAVKLPSLLAETGRAHLLNVKTSQGLPQTFYFRFRPVGSEIVAIGEINSLEIQALRAGMISANNELSNLGRELQKRNAELVKLNELKNQFLGMAAHDLRNPIGIIFSYSNFLLDEAGDHLNTEHVEFLSAIRGSSEFMLGLLEDLLDITRIESGKLNLDKEPTDIIAFIRHNVTLNQTLAKKKGIGIRFNHYEVVPEIHMDRHKMDQVLNNLISNALKFSPPDTTVTVSVCRSGDHVTVSVKDEGPGIPEEERDRLFKPFSKTSVRATGGEKCTGLGLSIVRKIVVGHLGKIWVESKVGKGSNFCFSLPFSSVEVASTAS
jgi:signal transduction histidine kinase